MMSTSQQHNSMMFPLTTTTTTTTTNNRYMIPFPQKVSLLPIHIGGRCCCKFDASNFFKIKTTSWYLGTVIQIQKYNNINNQKRISTRQQEQQQQQQQQRTVDNDPLHYNNTNNNNNNNNTLPSSSTAFVPIDPNRNIIQQQSTNHNNNCFNGKITVMFDDNEQRIYEFPNEYNTFGKIINKNNCYYRINYDSFGTIISKNNLDFLCTLTNTVTKVQVGDTVFVYFQNGAKFQRFEYVLSNHNTTTKKDTNNNKKKIFIIPNHHDTISYTNSWYRGIVIYVNDNCTLCHVAYDDGDIEMNIPCDSTSVVVRSLRDATKHRLEHLNWMIGMKVPMICSDDTTTMTDSTTISNNNTSTINNNHDERIHFSFGTIIQLIASPANNDNIQVEVTRSKRTMKVLPIDIIFHYIFKREYQKFQNKKRHIHIWPTIEVPEYDIIPNMDNNNDIGNCDNKVPSKRKKVKYISTNNTTTATAPTIKAGNNKTIIDSTTTNTTKRRRIIHKTLNHNNNNSNYKIQQDTTKKRTVICKKQSNDDNMKNIAKDFQTNTTNDNNDITTTVQTTTNNNNNNNSLQKAMDDDDCSAINDNSNNHNNLQHCPMIRPIFPDTLGRELVKVVKEYPHINIGIDLLNLLIHSQHHIPSRFILSDMIKQLISFVPNNDDAKFKNNIMNHYEVIQQCLDIIYTTIQSSSNDTIEYIISNNIMNLTILMKHINTSYVNNDIIITPNNDSTSTKIDSMIRQTIYMKSCISQIFIWILERTIQPLRLSRMNCEQDDVLVNDNNDEEIFVTAKKRFDCELQLKLQEGKAKIQQTIDKLSKSISKKQQRAISLKLETDLRQELEAEYNQCLTEISKSSHAKANNNKQSNDDSVHMLCMKLLKIPSSKTNISSINNNNMIRQSIQQTIETCISNWISHGYYIFDYNNQHISSYGADDNSILFIQTHLKKLLSTFGKIISCMILYYYDYNELKQQQHDIDGWNDIILFIGDCILAEKITITEDDDAKEILIQKMQLQFILQLDTTIIPSHIPLGLAKCCNLSDLYDCIIG